MLLNYLKIAFKVLLRRKFFTAISLFGIGFTLTAILVVAALADSVLAPLTPEVNLDRTLQVWWMMVSQTTNGLTRQMSGSAGYAFLDRYVRDLPGVEKMSIASDPFPATRYVEGRTETWTMRTTDGEYWEILRFDFLEGGPLTQEDERSGNRVAVISEAARRAFFGDRPALGGSVDLDGQRYRVVGVVRNVNLLRVSAAADVWAPHSTRKSQDFRQFHFAGEFSALLLARSRADFPRIKAGFRSRLELAKSQEGFEALLGTPETRLEMLASAMQRKDDAEPPIGALIWQSTGALLLFMLLPTLNLVSINMSRILERASEIGVRKAFGASAGHLVGQFILENIFLCLVGGVLALGGTAVVLHGIGQSGLVPHLDVRLNYRVFLIALGVACFFGVLSGALPAWQMSRLHPVRALRGGAR